MYYYKSEQNFEKVAGPQTNFAENELHYKYFDFICPGFYFFIDFKF